MSSDIVTAAVLLIGMGLTPFTDSATAFTTRLMQVLAASAYTVGAYMLLERLLPPISRLSSPPP